MSDPRHNNNRVEKQNGTNDSPYQFLVPGSFKSKNVESQKSNPREIVEGVVFNPDKLYDRMARHSPNQDMPEVNGVKLDEYNLVLQKSLRNRDPIIERNATTDVAEADYRPNQFSHADKLKSQMTNSLRSLSDINNPERLQEIISNLEQAKINLDDKLPDGRSTREMRIHGAERNLQSCLNELNPLKNPTNVGLAFVSEGVKQCYKPLHYFGKVTDWAFGWKVFEAPPTSLVDETIKRVTEVSKEIKFHKSILEQQKSASQAVDILIKEIIGLKGQLEGEQDPGRLAAITNSARTKIEEATEKLVKGLNSDDPKLKEEWDKMRKAVSAGLQSLDSQLTTAETVLHATEKGIVIAGAVGAAGVTGGASLGIAGGIIVGTGVGAVASAAQKSGHLVSHTAIHGGVSSEFIRGEVMAFGSDVRDSALRASGNGVSTVVLGGVSKIVASNSDKLLSLGARAGLNALARNPLSGKLWSQATVVSAQTAGGFAKGVAGGATRGMITEAPAALFDTTYSLYYDPQSLDPTGQLAEKGLNKQTILVTDRDGNTAINAVWLRTLSTRLGCAMTGGALSHGFQPARTNIKNFIAPTVQTETSVAAAAAEKPLLERIASLFGKPSTGKPTLPPTPPTSPTTAPAAPIPPTPTAPPTTPTLPTTAPTTPVLPPTPPTVPPTPPTPTPPTVPPTPPTPTPPTTAPVAPIPPTPTAPPTAPTTPVLPPAPPTVPPTPTPPTTAPAVPIPPAPTTPPTAPSTVPSVPTAPINPYAPPGTLPNPYAPPVVPPLTTSANTLVGAVSAPRRIVARAVSELVTIPEIALDAYSSIYTERVIRGWYGEKNGGADQKLLEQALTSSIGGHISGRMHGSAMNQFVERRRYKAAVQADAMQKNVNSQSESLGVAAPREVVTAIGSDFATALESTTPASNKVGYNLGSRDGLAGKRAAQLEHRSLGENAAEVDRRLGGRIESHVKSAQVEVSQKLKAGPNDVGRLTGLADNRAETLTALERNMERRAAGIAALGEPPKDGNRKALAEYADKLNEHIRRFSEENPADPSRSLVQTLRSASGALISGIKAIPNSFETRVSKPVKETVKRFYEKPWDSISNIPNNLLNFSISAGTYLAKNSYTFVNRSADLLYKTPDKIYSYAENVFKPFANQHPDLIIKDKVEPKNKSFVTWISDLPLFGSVYKLSKASISNLAPAGTGVGIGLFSAPSASYYGSWGIYGGGLYAGAVATYHTGKLAGATILAPALSVYRVLKLDQYVYNKGSAEGAANMLARKQEASVLLSEARSLQKQDPSLVSFDTIRKLRAERQYAERMFEKANNRHGGFLGYLILNAEWVGNLTFNRASEKALTKLAGGDEPQLSKLADNPRTKLESSNRFIADDSVKGLERTLAELFRSVKGTGLVSSTRDAGRNFIREMQRSDLDLVKVQNLKNHFLGDDSPLSSEKKDKLRNRAIQVIEERLAKLKADHRDRAKLELAKDIFSDINDPLATLRAQTEILNISEKDGIVSITAARGDARVTKNEDQQTFSFELTDAHNKAYFDGKVLTPAQRKEALREIAFKIVDKELSKLKDSEKEQPRFAFLTEVLRNKPADPIELRNPRELLTKAQRNSLIETLVKRTEKEIAHSRDFEYSRQVLTELLSGKNNFTPAERTALLYRINSALDLRSADPKLPKDVRDHLDKFKIGLNTDNLELRLYRPEKLVNFQAKEKINLITKRIAPDLIALTKKFERANPSDQAKVGAEIYNLISQEIARSGYSATEGNIKSISSSILKTILVTAKAQRLTREIVFSTDDGKALLKAFSDNPKDPKAKKALGALLEQLVDLPFKPKDKGDFLQAQWGRNLEKMTKDPELLVLAEKWKTADLTEKKDIQDKAQKRAIQLDRPENSKAFFEKILDDSIDDVGKNGSNPKLISKVMKVIGDKASGLSLADLNLPANKDLNFILDTVFGADKAKAFGLMHPSMNRFDFVQKYVLTSLNLKRNSADPVDQQVARDLAIAFTNIADAQGRYRDPKRVIDKDNQKFILTMKNKIQIEEAFSKHFTTVNPQVEFALRKLVEFTKSWQKELDVTDAFKPFELRLKGWRNLSDSAEKLLAVYDPNRLVSGGLQDLVKEVEYIFGSASAKELIGKQIGRLDSNNAKIRKPEEDSPEEALTKEQKEAAIAENNRQILLLRSFIVKP